LAFTGLWYRIDTAVRQNSMEISEDFRRRAARCIERSRTPKSELAKATWLDMAQFWLSLARQAERAGDRGEEASPATDAAGDGHRMNGRTGGLSDGPDGEGPSVRSNPGQHRDGDGQRMLPRH
jgi:hypothetical protein